MAIAITSLIREQEKETGLLARAFVTNPLHIAVFGTDGDPLWFVKPVRHRG